MTAESLTAGGGREGPGERAPVLVLGIGNALRHDDGAGPEVIRRLRERASAAGFALCAHEGEPLALLELWEGADAVVLVDAIHDGATGPGGPGAIHRLDASRAALPERLTGSSSTHAIGVGEAIELARSLRRLPKRVILFGIEGRRFDAGSGFSDEVQAGLDPLVEAVLGEARRLAR